MSIHEDVEAVAEVVASADFKARQDAFYAKYCHEFVHDVDESTGNKLSYTTIHNDYVAETEEQITAAIGQERLSNIMANIGDSASCGVIS